MAPPEPALHRKHAPRVLIVALNFPPELTGIGKYVGEMTERLDSEGIPVRVVTAPPYYPAWQVSAPYSAWRYGRERVAGADVIRCPLLVSRRPGLLLRLLHLSSFALSSAPAILWTALRWRPDLVIVIEPPLMCAPVAWLAGRLCGAFVWLHVQDFEVDAAFDLGILRAGRLRRFAGWAERMLMRRFDRVSSISGRMVERLVTKGVAADRTWLFPNWVDTSEVSPMARLNALRRDLGIPDHLRVLLYSGNMGEKQGLDLLIEVARGFDPSEAVLFLLCGDGAVRTRLESEAAGLAHVRFVPLQPRARLAELLALADIHLLPQRADAEDLVLPSKLTAMMASQRPVIATATPGSEVGRAAEVGGLVVPPGDAEALTGAIRRLLEDSPLREQRGMAGRAHARANWERTAVLDRFVQTLRDSAKHAN